MCGIIGYTGKENAAEKIVYGLKVLEYRGYDSAGVCIQNDKEYKTVKVKGKVDALKEKIDIEKPKGVCGIGHTRWATHGAPSDINAHPHTVGKTHLVHNGIIENYKELRTELENEGVKFFSETDTEVGCGLINFYYEREGDGEKAILSAVAKMQGSYAFGVMFDGERDTVYAIRKGSPLLIAKGEDGYYLASDMTALLPFTNIHCQLKEGELAKLTKERAFLSGGKEPEWKKTEMNFESAQKNGYEHFMLKEIFEQPSAVKKCLSPRIVNGLPDFTCDGMNDSFFKEIEEIHVVACGSAMHSGIVASNAIEKIAKVPARAYIASEYRYSPPVARENTLVIVISQSGETADSIASLRYAKSVGMKTLGIVNAVETTIANEADKCAYTYAGPEIAVATTKGYITQVALMYLFAIELGLKKEKIDEKYAKFLTECLIFNSCKGVESVLDRKEEIKEIAKSVYEKEDIFYIGRGIDYALSLEAALKLKEISYIHCEAYAAGELKHGTISLIEEGTPVIAIATEENLFEKTESNIKEVKSRGAYTVLICSEDMKEPEKCADVVFKLPKSCGIDKVFLSIAVVQLIAYYVSYFRGCDIDKPRNLAKSVTVE